MKDNTNLELCSKWKGLKMSLSGKITNISCQIDLRAIEPASKSLIFRPLYRMVVRFMLRKDLISLILAITRSGLLMLTNTHVSFSAHFLYVITKEKKSVTH